MQVIFEMTSSISGHLLVASTDAGVCAVLPGASQSMLQKDCLTKFPRAQNGRVSLMDTVLRRLSGEDETLHVPLHLEGTEFQKRVWEILLRIPAGETRSYEEVACAVGIPQGVRAVAQACARNVLYVLVPCHRVISKNGALGGYRWGVERKAELLRGEQR